MGDSFDIGEKLLMDEKERVNPSLICCGAHGEGADVYSDDIIVDGRDQIILSDASGDIKMDRPLGLGYMRVSKILTTTSFLVFQASERSASSGADGGGCSRKEVGDKILLRLDLKDVIGAKGFVTTDSSGNSTYAMKVFEYKKFISSSCGTTTNYRKRMEYSFSFPSEAACYAWTSSILNILHARGDANSMQYSIKNIVGDKNRTRTSTDDLVKMSLPPAGQSSGSSGGGSSGSSANKQRGGSSSDGGTPEKERAERDRGDRESDSPSYTPPQHTMYTSGNSVSSIGYLRKYLVVLNPVSVEYNGDV